MFQLMKDGQSAPRFVHKTGGMERLEHLPPQLPPAPLPCPPAPCPPIHAGPPVGPPIAVHEPAAGQRVDLTVVPNQPLIFDFNPLDLKASEHGGNVTLAFPDGAQIVLNQIVGPCGPPPAAFELPDGTVLTPAQLLEYFHLDAIGACEAVPHHAPPPPPPVEHGGFYFPPFDIGEIGPGLDTLGPLGPTGFGYFAEFLKGTGGGFGTPGGPGGPPGPPPPPPTPFTVQDVDPQDYFQGVDTGFSISGNYITTDTFGGAPIVNPPNSPPVFVTEFATPGAAPLTFGTVAPAGGTLEGAFGSLTMNANGSYTYNLGPGTTANGTAVLPELGSDLLSQTQNAHFSTYSYEFQDPFDVVTSNGTETVGDPPADIKQIQFDFFAAVVPSAPAALVVAAAPAATTELLLTYTDMVDPAHSFQQLVSVSTGGAVTVTPESGTIVQPNDPALVSLEYLSGSALTATSLTIEGETITGLTPVGPGGTHAVTSVINPNLNALGDPGDTGSVDNIGASQDTGANPAALTVTSAYTDALSGLSGASGYLYDTNTGSAAVVMSGGAAANADILNFDGTPGTTSTTITGSSAAAAANVIEWESGSLLSNGSIPGLSIDGGDGNGLNTLELESATSQNLDFTSNLTSGGATPNVSNIQVFDLTDGAHAAVANSITLSADDVFNLAKNEPTALVTAGGAYALWVNGSAADSVVLAGSGTTWTQISPQVTAVNQPGGNFTQMVGFTEYSAVAPTSGATVHVYVQNAIQAAAHVVAH
jgi:hypothetical protein